MASVIGMKVVKADEATTDTLVPTEEVIALVVAEEEEVTVEEEEKGWFASKLDDAKAWYKAKTAESTDEDNPIPSNLIDADAIEVAEPESLAIPEVEVIDTIQKKSSSNSNDDDSSANLDVVHKVETVAVVKTDTSLTPDEEEALALLLAKKEMATKKVKHAKQELECLALNAYHEARGESETGQLATMFVVKNRLDKGWRLSGGGTANTFCDVISDNKQFSWLYDTRKDRPLNKKVYDKIVDLARAFQAGDYPMDMTMGATHYHANRVSPYWATGDNPSLRYTNKIGRHIFYKKD